METQILIQSVNTTTITINEDIELMARLLREKVAAFNFRERRHQEWTDNYDLNRNKVKTNRLTQRQAIGIPLMKETNKTILANIDETPEENFKELGGDQMKEMNIQEMWNADSDTGNLEIVDMQDKKNVCLYGRGFIKLNIKNKNNITFTALDAWNILIDPKTRPEDLETAKYLVHINIFKTVREVLASKRYSETAKASLKTYLAGPDAVMKGQENEKELREQRQRLMDMGVSSDKFDTFSPGDTILTLSEHITNIWDTKKEEFARYVCTYANDNILLQKETLEDAIGINVLPYTTWGDDIETNDIWSDGPSDTVRNINKILNVWFSQHIENRTLRNFQMQWYDSTIKGYQPQTYEPGPGRMLPAPGDPNKTIKAVEVSGLEDTLTAIQFLIGLVESATAATAQPKGESQKKQITLGEVQILVGKAMQRMAAMAKFYRRARKELAYKWYLIKEANTGDNDKVMLYKVSAKGKVWGKEVKGSEWKSEVGYRVISQSASEQDEEKAASLNRLLAVQSRFPNNKALAVIVQKRSLGILDLTPDEMKQVEEEEKRNVDMAQNPPAPAPPAVSPEVKQLSQSMGQVKQMLQPAPATAPAIQ